MTNLDCLDKSFVDDGMGVNLRQDMQYFVDSRFGHLFGNVSQNVRVIENVANVLIS